MQLHIILQKHAFCKKKEKDKNKNKTKKQKDRLKNYVLFIDSLNLACVEIA